jgi:hypothetical protein
MCKEEASKTLLHQSLQYSRNREKCFSPSVNWVQSVVMSGRFNNSQHCSGRYTELLEFIFTANSAEGFRQCNNEWKTHIRKSHQIQLISVSHYDKLSPSHRPNPETSTFSTNNAS